MSAIVNTLFEYLLHVSEAESENQYDQRDDDHGSGDRGGVRQVDECHVVLDELPYARYEAANQLWGREVGQRREEDKDAAYSHPWQRKPQVYVKECAQARCPQRLRCLVEDGVYLAHADEERGDHEEGIRLHHHKVHCEGRVEEDGGGLIDCANGQENIVDYPLGAQPGDPGEGASRKVDPERDEQKYQEAGLCSETLHFPSQKVRDRIGEQEGDRGDNRGRLERESQCVPHTFVRECEAIVFQGGLVGVSERHVVQEAHPENEE